MLLAGHAATTTTASAASVSVFTARPDDPAAVYLTAPDFNARGDGQTDDSAAIQAAIDKAGAQPGNGGSVFIPSGRYRLTRTIYVWRGVRVFGYGETRPVFVLAANTPGYQKGIGLMVMFSHGRAGALLPPGQTRVAFPPPGQVPPAEVPDATPSTFYPGMSNIDFEIGEGNPAAVAIRFHVAQHGVLSHMEFHTGSGLAALTQIGNEAEDLHFYGGRYGILTDNTSPFWQFTLIDSVFEGQRDAAIREHMAGLTLIRNTFRDVPIAIDIDPTYSDQLWVKDSRFENVSNAVVVISNEKNATTEVGFENAVCAKVPVFARWRESGRTQAASAPMYRVKTFNYGLFVPALGAMGQLDTRYEATPLSAMPEPLAPAIAPLPAMTDWVNVHTLGVKGDGVADDTAAIQQAIASHRVLYFPIGFYVVRDTITLKPDTIVIALHPGLTQFDLPDSTPAYQGVGPAKAVLESPQGGRNIVSGLGIYTGGINPRAAGIIWMAGEQSLLNDIQFLGGGGTFFPANIRTALYPTAARGGSPFAAGRWGAQYPSLWVTRGGGGSFANIWTPNTYAQGGFYVSDTKTPGHVYELSAEHHLFNEIKLERVENWDFNAPQTEEEAPSSPESVSFEITSSKNISINNYHAYRVTRTHLPFPAAARIYNSSAIHFRNVHVNAESGYGTCDDNGCGTFLRVSKYPYDNAIQDVSQRLEVREREFAVLDVGAAGTVAATATGTKPVPAATAGTRRVPTAAAGTTGVPVPKLEKLEEGFFAISGAAVDPKSGTLYFVDHHQHRIYAWSRARGLEIVSHDPLDPVSVAVDKSGHLLVQSSAGREGTVYSLTPNAPGDITVIEPKAGPPAAGASIVLPANVWDNGEFANQLNFETYEYKTLSQMFSEDVTTPRAKAYVSPDGSLYLPAPRVFRQGPDDNYPGMDETGWRWSNNLTTIGFLTAPPGQRVYIASSAENRTYSATIQANGTLGDLKPFADRGGESVATDATGNVYIANGQIFVYNPAGKVVSRIDVPERPIQLLFGGPDHRTLFILTHHTLYAMKARS